MKMTSRVVIVGGGTAGWLTAGTLAASFAKKYNRPPSIVLVESPNVPTVGVGEGTWPTMRRTLRDMGIREADFIRECNASFKQGALFAGWTTGLENDAYYHPLVLPAGYFDTNLVSRWNERTTDFRSFADAVSPQAAICNRGLAPKCITTPEYADLVNYAYHLDAGLFATFLKNHCVKNLGIEHVSADVTQVRPDSDGNIAAICTQDSAEIAGDLFIDCTGSRALLLSGHYGVPFRSCKDVLFIDRALAMQVPYGTPDAPIASHTISTAKAAGWIWDIGLQSRRGVGHVFSSAHCDEEGALEVLHSYVRGIGGDPDLLDVRQISFEPGHREKFWVGNCVAVGLSAGFLEPLEASAILLIEISARFIAEQFPLTQDVMRLTAGRFNETFTYRWDRIIDFLKLHYVLSRRRDHSFWIDNRQSASVPQSLQDLMDLWAHQPPWHDDFDRAVEVFPAASYQYILYGMGFETRSSVHGVSKQFAEASDRLMMENAQRAEELLSRLPSNRELLGKIKQYGLARV